MSIRSSSNLSIRVLLKHQCYSVNKYTVYPIAQAAVCDGHITIDDVIHLIKVKTDKRLTNITLNYAGKLYDLLGNTLVVVYFTP